MTVLSSPMVWSSVRCDAMQCENVHSLVVPHYATYKIWEHRFVSTIPVSEPETHSRNNVLLNIALENVRHDAHCESI